MKKERKLNIRSVPEWTPEFAYAVGLLTTDGSLSIDGRHIVFGSKDLELVKLLKVCLKLTNTIGVRPRGRHKLQKYYYIQFGSLAMYNFLLKFGLMPRKSYVLGALDVPEKYLFDFLRGHFDGDGSFYSYRDKRYPRSFLFFLNFASASLPHLYWLRSRLSDSLGVNGHISASKNSAVLKLRFGKAESVPIFRKMYYASGVPTLRRKRLKVRRALDTIGVRL